MYLNENQMLNLRLRAEGKINESDIVKIILNEDMFSPLKKKMADGERYYSYEHDILKKRFDETSISETFGDRDVLTNFKNPNRSNEHTVNGFHRLLVDQKASYILSKPPTLSVKGSGNDEDLLAYEEYICNFAEDELWDCFFDMVIGASNKGYEVLQVYYDKDGNLRYSIVPSEEVILIYDLENQNKLKEVIRYYSIAVMNNGKRENRRRVEWWTEDKVTYYTEKEGQYFAKEGESPHFWSVSGLSDMEKVRKPQSFGRLPFIVLKNNHRCTTDLEAVKGLIDAYDLISSEGVNNLLDLVDLYWVIEGYGGDAAAAIAKKLKINKAVHISDSSGKVEAKQVELPMAGRINYLKLLRKDIFTFGQGVDIEEEKLGGAASGVSLKFQYTLLDLKAGRIANKIKAAIKELLWFVTQDYNRRFKKNIDAKLIDVVINKTMITNDTETSQIIAQSRGLVSEKTLLAKHPFVEDVNAELKQKDVEEMDQTQFKGL